MYNTMSTSDSAPSPARPNPWLDRFGTAVSLGCGVHCAAITLLLTFNPALWLRWAWKGHMRWLWWLELSLVILAIVLALWALTLGWLRHRRWPPILFAIPGLGGIVLGLGSHLHQRPFLGAGLTLAGGLLMLLAHGLNWRAQSRRTTPHRD